MPDDATSAVPNEDKSKSRNRDMFRRQMLIEVDRPVDSASLNYAVEQIIADARQQGVSDAEIQRVLESYGDAIDCDDLDVEPIDGTETATN